MAGWCWRRARGEVLRGNREVRLRSDVPRDASRRAQDRPPRAPPSRHSIRRRRALWEALRAWRLDEARRQELPPYVIFHDATLIEVAPPPAGIARRAGRHPRHRPQQARALRRRAAGGYRRGPTIISRVNLPPVLGDVAPGAEPDPVAAGDVIEELDQPGDPARPPDQPVVQGQRHQLRPLRALGVEGIEAVDHVAGEIVAGRKAVVVVEAVVVGLERIGDDQVAARRRP